MRKKFWVSLILSVLWLVVFPDCRAVVVANAGAAELSAPVYFFGLPAGDGKIYLGWRLDSKNPQMGYNVYRQDPGGKFKKVNAKPIADSTNYLDGSGIKDGKTYTYYVRAVDSGTGQESGNSAEVEVTAGKGTNIYSSIEKIHPNTGSARVKVGDIDADGLPDFLVVCRKSPDSAAGEHDDEYEDTGDYGNLHVKVLYNNGKQACDIDMGETEKVLRTAWTFWDLNGDGKDELIGVMKKAPGSNQYSLYVMDPTASGKVLSQIDVPSSPPVISTRFKTMTIAYLDGKRPYILYGAGHEYSQHRYVNAYTFDAQSGLKIAWSWDKAASQSPKTDPSSSHQFEVVDIDGDGKDEAFLGVYVYDEKGIWKDPWGGHMWSHADGVHAGPIKSELDVYFHLEETPGGIHVTDCQGNIEWEKGGDCIVGDRKVLHAHAGWIGDVVKNSPGWEVWVMHKDTGATGMCCPFLYSANGQMINRNCDLRGGTVDWDGALPLEVISGNNIIERFNDSGTQLSQVKAIGNKVELAMDVVGDYREEVIAFDNYQGYLRLQVYTNINLNSQRKPSPCDDRQYLERHRWAGH
jgi:hypothetical protein